MLERPATVGSNPRATAKASPFLVIQWKQPQARSDPGSAVPAGASCARPASRRGGASEPSPTVIGWGRGDEPEATQSHVCGFQELLSGTPRQREAASPHAPVQVRASLLAEVS